MGAREGELSVGRRKRMWGRPCLGCPVGSGATCEDVDAGGRWGERKQAGVADHAVDVPRPVLQHVVAAGRGRETRQSRQVSRVRPGHTVGTPAMGAGADGGNHFLSQDWPGSAI